MFPQMIRIGVGERAKVTFIWPGIQMLRHDVTVQEALPFECPRTSIALELFLFQMRRLLVRGQIRLLSECSTAKVAGERFLSRVHSLVISQVGGPNKSFATVTTIKSGRFVLRLMLMQSSQTLERLLADSTLEIPLRGVRLLVLPQGGVGEEGFATLITGEWPFPFRVDLYVAVVNILGRELCGTHFAFVRSLARV